MTVRLLGRMTCVAILAAALAGSCAAVEAGNGSDPGDGPGQPDPVAAERRLVRAYPNYPLDPATGRAMVMVQLAEEPSAGIWVDTLRVADPGWTNPAVAGAGTRAPRASAVLRAADAARAHRANLQTAQAGLAQKLKSQGIAHEELFRAQRLYNGVAMLVDPARIPEIRALPGVKAVRPLIPKEPDLDYSVPLHEAGLLWSKRPGYTGQGVRIGIIDTGLDYLHKDFAGPGTGYQDNITTAIGDVPGFPGARVVGGWDFVGDAYNSVGSGDALIPHPDPDPMDCNGHGTHVAGIAAGSGVTPAYQTYTGFYSDTTSETQFHIGPGMAPQALIYALRVFGCGGSTNMVVPALEWASDPNNDGNFSDHLDVVNMSLGSNIGIDESDPDSEATNNAVVVGVAVACSSGNSGDTYFITGSPGVARRAISTANTSDKASRLSRLGIVAPPSIAGTCLAAEAAFGPPYKSIPVTTGTLAYPSDSGQQLGCAPFNPTNAAALAGKIALIDRGTCTYESKVLNAQNAGAIAVLVANNADGPPVTLGDDSATNGVTIPSLMVSKAQGTLFKAHLADPGGGQVVFNPAYHNVESFLDPGMTDQMSASSSRGPSPSGGFLKPDLSAVGDSVFSAQSGSGFDGVSLSGTSMASPHVAGALAQLKQLYPSWSPARLKALVMNVTPHDVFLNKGQVAPTVGPGRSGVGRLDMGEAAYARAILYDRDAPERVSITYGFLEPTTITAYTRWARLENFSTHTMTCALKYVPAVNNRGTTVILGGVEDKFTLNPGEIRDVPVTLSVNPALMDRARDASVAATQGSRSRSWICEETGYLQFTGAGTVLIPNRLRLAVHAVVRPASTMQAVEKALKLTATTGTLNLHWQGQTVNTGATANDHRAVVSLFELQEESPADPAAAPPVKASDFRYLGVTSDIAYQLTTGKTVADAYISFGVAMHGRWSAPIVPTVTVLIDSNRDGTMDYEIYNTSAGSAVGGTHDNVFYTVVHDIAGGSYNWGYPVNLISPATMDTVHFDTDMMVMCVKGSQIGLSSAQSRFNYYAYTTNWYVGGFPDVTGLHTYDAASPGLDLTGGTSGAGMWNEAPGATTPVTYNRTAFQTNASRGILALHHYNTAGNHAEVIKVRSRPDLVVVNKDSIDPLMVNQTVTYAIGLRNDGPVAANSVVLTDTRPSGWIVTAASITAGSLGTSNSTTLSYNIGTLAPDAGVTLTLTLRPTVAGDQANTATATTSSTEDYPPDNTAVERTRVLPFSRMSPDQLTTSTGWQQYLQDPPSGDPTYGNLTQLDYDGANTAIRARIQADPGTATGPGVAGLFRAAGWRTTDAYALNALPYSSVGTGNYVRAKWHVYATGSNPPMSNMIPAIRMQVYNRTVVGTTLEVFTHKNDGTAGISGDELGAEIRPGSDSSNPSVYRCDYDPVDVPFLVSNAATESIGLGFIAQSEQTQDNGTLGLAEVMTAVYPKSLAAGTLIQTLQPSASDAGGLKTTGVTTPDGTGGPSRLRFIYPFMGPGRIGFADFSGGPAISEGAAGVTMDSVAFDNQPSGGLPTRAGISLLGFYPGNAYGSRPRVMPGKQYRIRFHVVGTRQSNLQAGLRLQAVAGNFTYSQKVEISGSTSGGSQAQSILAQTQPGSGCQNPEKRAAESGGYYNLLVYTPLAPEVRPENPVLTLQERMPNWFAFAGQGVNDQGAVYGGATPAGLNRRDLRLFAALLDTLTFSGGAVNEASNYTVDEIQVYEAAAVYDGTP